MLPMLPMLPTAYILRQPLTARRPTRWDVHARYALRLPDESRRLPAGSWLLPLPPPDDDRPTPPHYRLADGTVICLEAPLTPAQAAPLTDTQARTALAAYRPLEQALLEDWGVWTEHIDRTPPFRVIHCPLCGGTAFTTVALAEVWCDGCHAQFSVRHTAGDPGFVVDCTWPFYQPGAARYLLPRSDELLLTMVFKRGGDPLALTHTGDCHRAECTPQQVALTDGQDGPLRAGLHACQIGDVYDWSFYGRVPAVYDHDRHGHYDLLWPAADGDRQEAWPHTAFVPVSGCSGAERQRLADMAARLRSGSATTPGRDDAHAFLQELLARPGRAPFVGYRSVWPSRRQLQANERYLLHRWLVQQEKQDGWLTAAPVWLVVTDVAADKYHPQWRVVRDNICPHCGQAVSAADAAASAAANAAAGAAPLPDHPWAVPHGHCRALWQAHQWQPTLFGP